MAAPQNGKQTKKKLKRARCVPKRNSIKIFVAFSLPLAQRAHHLYDLNCRTAPKRKENILYDLFYTYFLCTFKSACWVLLAGNRRNSLQGQRGAIRVFIFRLSAMRAPKNLRSTKAERKYLI